MTRERAWDWLIDNKGYLQLRNPDGTPVYRTDAVPAIAGESAQIAEERREYPSLHGGFGHARFLSPLTYDYGDCIDTTRPRRVVMPPLITSMTALASVTGGFVELGTTFWVGAGRYLQKVDTTNDDLETPDNNDYTLGVDFGAGNSISSLLPWDSLIDVWFSTATDGRTFSGSAAPTTLSGANVRRVYSTKFFSENANAFVQAGSATVSGDPAVTWIAQGAAIDSAIGANWSAAYDVGDDTKPITGLASGRKQVWVGKPDGLYQVDGASGRPWREVEAYPVADSNGVGLFVDSMQRVWYPSQGGLLRYDRNTASVQDVTPGRGLSHDSTIYGRVTAVAQYRGWFFAAIYNGTTSYVMQGRDREEGDPGIGAVVWHGAIAKLTGQISHLYVLGTTTPPRLYMAAGTTVAYIRLDASYRYAATGKLYFPADNMGSLGSRWHLAGFVITGKGFSSSTYADIYAQIDNGEWQLVNRLQASGRVFVPIPSGDWRFTELAFRFDFVNASSTSTPELWGVTLLATRRVHTRQLIQTSLICSKRIATHYGVKTRRSGSRMVRELESLAVERSVTASDYLTGEKRDRQVLVQPIQTRLMRFGEKDQWEEWAEVVDVTMVAQSSASVQVDAPIAKEWGTFDWGDGTRWG